MVKGEEMDAREILRHMIYDWREACQKCINWVDRADFEDKADMAITAAQQLLGLAYNLKGVQCPQCGGLGEKAYGSTATFRGGIGGQMITSDVCDGCWGTGRTDKKGPDRRKYKLVKR